MICCDMCGERLPQTHRETKLTGGYIKVTVKTSNPLNPAIGEYVFCQECFANIKESVFEEEAEPKKYTQEELNRYHNGDMTDHELLKCIREGKGLPSFMPKK